MPRAQYFAADIRIPYRAALRRARHRTGLVGGQSQYVEPACTCASPPSGGIAQILGFVLPNRPTQRQAAERRQRRTWVRSAQKAMGAQLGVTFVQSRRHVVSEDDSDSRCSLLFFVPPRAPGAGGAATTKSARHQSEAKQPPKTKDTLAISSLLRSNTAFRDNSDHWAAGRPSPRTIWSQAS